MTMGPEPMTGAFSSFGIAYPWVYQRVTTLRTPPQILRFAQNDKEALDAEPLLSP